MKKNTVVKLAGAAALLAGCQSMKKTAQKDDFPVENDARSYRRLAASQEAAGARHDGTLTVSSRRPVSITPNCSDSKMPRTCSFGAFSPSLASNQSSGSTIGGTTGSG